MTEEIIIDGVDVSECEFYTDSKNIEYNCKQTPQSYFCKNKPDCYYKQLKAKEQECEELKTDNATLFDKAMETRKENTNMQVQLYQLKAENKLFRTCHDNEQEKRRKYEQTLTEIKEITKENIRIADLEGLNSVYRRGLATQILQKISECEVKHG